jgi:valyl-tRNA synthetase
VGEITISSDCEVPKPAARAFPAGVEIHVPLAGLIDLDKERKRLEKTLAKAEAEIASQSGKLSNEKFLARAPAEVIEHARKLRDELSEKAVKLKESLGELE